MLTLAACGGAQDAGPSGAAQSPATNPLLAEWSGPYDGVPAFDGMSLADLAPALDEGMRRQLAEIDAIASHAEPPTFDNTIVALERSGKDLDRVLTYYGIWSANVSSPEFRDIQQATAPRLAAHGSRITQNRVLFDRIRAVHDGDEVKSLTPAQQRLVQLTYDGFARNGATLDGDAAERYAAINQRLAELHARFSNNVLADEEAYVTCISADQLGGLPPSFVAAAKAAGERRCGEGGYA